MTQINQKPTEHIKQAQVVRENNKKILAKADYNFYKQAITDDASRRKMFNAIKMLRYSIDLEDPKVRADLKDLLDALNNDPDINGQREQSNKFGIRSVDPQKIQEEERKKLLNIELRP